MTDLDHLAGENTASNLRKARERAWETRRAKYGPHGHAGSYARGSCQRCASMQLLLVRLHNEGVLSEGQVVRATGLHRIDVRTLADSFSEAAE